MRTVCLVIFCFLFIEVDGQRIAKFVISPGAGTFTQKDVGTVHYIFNDLVTGYAIGQDGSKLYAGFLTPLFSSNSTPVSSTEKNAFKVFPNPFTNQLTLISQSNKEQATVQLLDLNGRLFFTEKGNLNHHQIYTGTFGSGIYMLKIIYPDGHFEVYKLIKM